MKNLHIKKILLILFSIVLFFIGWFAWLIYTDEPPQFFPLNNPEGEYKISKKCPGGQGWGENINGSNNLYCVEYRGSGVFMDEESGNTHFFRVTVGKSKIDLDPYIEKKIKVIEGQFVSSSKQCILDNCSDIGGPYVVLNINNIELAE